VEPETASYSLRRLGILMQPEQNNPAESWGVLNPGSARTASGDLLLYPRVVSEGNYSRIEIARVDPSEGSFASVERRGFALEPREAYEFDHRAGGGVEDPRVTFIAQLDLYVMTYVALGRLGPRVALAVSDDGWQWRRLGLLRFAADAGVDLNRCGNKDSAIFPDVVKDREGRDAFAILHRPQYLMFNEDGTVHRVLPTGVTDDRGSIWISYISAARAHEDAANLAEAHDTALLATPEQDWECLKIGAGTPPILLPEGWLIFYHGVSGQEPRPGQERNDVCYQAGAMLLDRDDPRKILYRSSKPVLSPEHELERIGVVPNVVFPTAVDVQGRTVNVFYGAADARIGVATTELPSAPLIAPSSPPSKSPDPPTASPALSRRP
jgi:beta-1,2-mannobiose phosphorylase / 1,2-beta-oligomannan phosphorylase